MRDDALVRDGEGVRVDEDCSVTGTWLDPYTGTTLTDSADVDVDYVVPLANAWKSGASRWGAAEREAYGKDPAVLLSVEAGVSRQKGTRGRRREGRPTPPTTASTPEGGSASSTAGG